MWRGRPRSGRSLTEPLDATPTGKVTTIDHQLGARPQLLRRPRRPKVALVDEDSHELQLQGGQQAGGTARSTEMGSGQKEPDPLRLRHLRRIRVIAERERR